MKNKTYILFWTCLVASVLAGAGCQLRGGHKPLGGVSIDREHLAGVLPTQGPRIVYVADFQLDARDYKGDQGVRGVLPGHVFGGGAGMLGDDLPHPLGTGDPAAAARAIVNEMSDALVSGLGKKGVAAVRLSPGETVLPSDGWLISGMFTEVDEGNRIKRAVMGFGQGATQMDVQVGISDLAGANPKAPFVIFGTVDDPKRLPGGAVTKNPYVAAAKFVLEKNATTRDVQNTADQIIAEILKFRDQVRSNPAR